jgi:nucleoid-associated protein YgaU
VQPGDNFSVIAQKLYGSARHYTAIEQANPGVDSRRLQVGQVIRVPDRDSVVSTPAVSTVAAVETAPASVDTSRQYRVQPNDSLYKIAQTLYGDGSRWEEIYQINRQAIGENPANLKVGQVLALPEAPAQSAAR